MAQSALLRRSVTWLTSTTMVLFGFMSGGLVSAQSTITNTGPNSTNTISSTQTNTCTVTNNNNLGGGNEDRAGGIVNTNNQTATSGDATYSDNTGSYWQGWQSLDPAVWQAQNQSFAAWQTAVSNWISQHGNSTLWLGDGSNSSWQPASNTWASFDPLLWQAQNQSFTNWFAMTNTWITNNSLNWMVHWTGTGSGNGNIVGGAFSGNASNTNSTSFVFNITNGPGVPHGSACGGQVSVNGRGGGGGGGSVGFSSNAIGGGRGFGGGGGGFGGGGFFAPRFSHPTGSSPVSHPSSPSTPGSPSTPPVVVSPPVNSISNTGPGSNNTISSTATNVETVTNNNNFSVANTNTQTASTGSATSTNNTGTGGAGSGGAANSNGTGVATTVNNT